MKRISSITTHLTNSTPSAGQEKENPVTVTIEGVNGEIGIISMSYASNMNALNHEMRTSLVQAFNTLESNPVVKVICLRSVLPKVFCAGANIKDIVQLTHEKRINHDMFKEVCNVINSCRKPIIAAINKLALGGGLEIALLCDVIICSEDATIGLPEIKLGVMPGIGGTLISKMIGKSNAMKMILTGESINAKTALELGVVSEVHKPEELHKKQLELAEKMAKYSLYSLALAKNATKFSFENPSSMALEHERRLFDSLMNLPGAKEGLPAFVEKRTPNFKGK
jgi:enoyl-CoA hydratase